MAASPDSFISPAGEITGEMFPDEDIEERAQGYLATVTADVGTSLTGAKLDVAIREGVYVLFYEAAAAKVINEPVQGNLADQGSAMWAQNRADMYLRMAEMHRERYNLAFIPEGSPPPKVPFGAVPTRITAP
jgi:hypothetical protein